MPVARSEPTIQGIVADHDHTSTVICVAYNETVIIGFSIQLFETYKILEVGRLPVDMSVMTSRRIFQYVNRHTNERLG
jgi:hypothetical protein